jgi:tetratricopeptide (TPR) repeat protein
MEAQSSPIEATALLGKPLLRISFSKERQKELEDQLETAIREHEAKPDDVDAYVWVGRRIAYLGRYRDAIDWFTRGLEKFGPNAKLLRHRGHRYISVREFAKAVSDFEKAAALIAGTPDEIEPDGVPNSRNVPISSLHSNIWYHLALSHYLLGDFEKALVACEKGMQVSNNPDRLVSQTYWKYLILRRLGKHDEADKALVPIRADLDVIENHAYLRLLLVYKGEISAEEAVAKATSGIDEPTIGYGVGVFALINGDREQAKSIFEKVIAGPNWPAFGYIAAEAELKRMVW